MASCQNREDESRNILRKSRIRANFQKFPSHQTDNRAADCLLIEKDAPLSPSKNVCRTHHCVSCCYDTEMPLLDDDVQRIVALGFEESYFTTNSDGFEVLKNSDQGRCVFHDGKQCTIYANRPAGCKLYPIIFNENLNRPVKDRLCPFRAEFDLSLESKQELTNVYHRLMREKNFCH
jgi:uncharacterized protein